MVWMWWGVALGQEPRLLATLEHEPIEEQSGIVQSRQWPGVYWIHNDSGDDSRLFAIRENGEIVLPPWEAENYRVKRSPRRLDPWPGLIVAGGANVDWEDVATDGTHLFIADVGNNGNARRDLGVYVLMEPNPLAVEAARPLTFWPVAYPQQREFPGAKWHYDCEAVFVHQGRLYFLTKHRVAGEMRSPERGTDLYRLDAPRPDAVNVLTHVDHLDDIGGWVTAADLSPDGKTLAVLVYAPNTAVWLFDTPDVGDAFLSGKPKVLPLDLETVEQVEGITWADERRLLITNEQRAIFELRVGA